MAEPVPRRYTSNIPLPSKLSVNSGNLAQNWKKFKRQFNNYAIASRLNQEESAFQTAVFLATIGEDAMEIFDGFKFDDPTQETNLEQVIKKFDDFCVGETHEAYESYKFHLRRQEPSESIEAYVTALRVLVKNCNFGTPELEDRMIRDQVVIGLKDDAVRQKLLEEKKLTLGKCIDIGRAYETSRQQTQSMAAGAETSSVQRVQKYGRERQNKPRKEKHCIRCGKTPSHSRKDCPASDAECRKCHLRGHYANMCRSKKIHRVEDSNSEEQIILGCLTTDVNFLSSSDMWHATIKVNGKPVRFRIDTGADVSVLPASYFVADSPLIQPTNKRLYGPGRKPMEVLGEVKMTLQTEKTQSRQELYVIPRLQEPLLGKPAIEALHLIERVNNVEIDKENRVKEDYPSVFTGLGKLSYEYKISLKEDSKPFAVTSPRRLALPLKEKVKKELENLTEQNVIRPVTEPTDWCAPIVCVPKTNNKVRVCVDLTKLNESVRRENFPLPSTDELLAQLSGAKVFSKLDCNSGFYQIPLETSSQLLTTFITPFGRYCYTRLPFGISSGPEIFQRAMTQLLAGQEGVICDIDDLLIFGKTQKDHDECLKTVLEKLKDAGVTLNAEKCEFSKDSMKFLGHIVSHEGIAIDPEKVKAIKTFPPPTNLTELRRFMGMVNHVSKFADGKLADQTRILRDLLKRDSEWTWDSTQEAAFVAIKTKLSSAPVLSHYDPNKETKISADASSFGLGAVLMQKQTDGSYRPVFYASRSLTPTEQRYAQVEKEALAVTWACEKFASYVMGLKNLTIETDHKPLLALFKTKHLDELTPRIQRFRMRMMHFTYNIVHVPGKDLMTADALSRAPGSVPAEQDRQMEVETNMYVRAVIEAFPASDHRMKQIKEMQDEDLICSQVKIYSQSGKWPEKARKDPALKPYWTVRYDLTVEEGLLLFQSRLVIPRQLQKDILHRLHQGHQGIVKCRALARNSVWWPCLSKQIEEEVSNCLTCEKERVLHPEPLKSTVTPDYPWQRIGADLFEWKGHHYLLLVDYYSRWIEITHLAQTTSHAVAEHMKSIFSRHGIPEVIVSDNGPQFSSREFTTFADSYGFVHLTSSPHHQQSNGEAERAVQTVKQLLKKADDPYIALLNYRATPLSHGLSPAELLQGRKLRTRVPTLPKQHVSDPRRHAQFRKVDAKLKARQKANFDRRHRATPLPRLEPGQPVWVKTPKEAEAVVTNPLPPTPSSPARSYNVQSQSGSQRRNRHQLRRRDHQPAPRGNAPPRATLTLPAPVPRPTDVAADEDTDVPTNQAVGPPATIQPQQLTTYTRSGRMVKNPDRLNL